MGVASLTDHAPVASLSYCHALLSSLGMSLSTCWPHPYFKFGWAWLILLTGFTWFQTTPLFQDWVCLHLFANHAPFFLRRKDEKQQQGNHREIITHGIFLFYFSNIQKTQNAIPLLLLWEKNYYCLNIPSEPEKLVHTVPSEPEMLVYTVALVLRCPTYLLFYPCESHK